MKLFRQVFSDREIISPGSYCAYNAFAGVILLAAAGLMLVEPEFGSMRAALSAGLAGLVLLSAIPVALRRPTAVDGLLIVHGLLFVLLGLWFAVDSIRWAFLAAHRGSFRYAPGLTLVLFTYGTLQLSRSGLWSTRGRMLRIAALTVGVAFEVVVGAALLLRVVRL